MLTLRQTVWSMPGSLYSVYTMAVHVFFDLMTLVLFSFEKLHQANEEKIQTLESVNKVKLVITRV